MFAEYLTWAVPVAAVVVTVLGLAWFNSGLRAPQDRREVRAPEQVEAEHVWGVAGAVAAGFGAALTCALASSWIDVVGRIPRAERYAFFAGVALFLAVAVALVITAPTWFRKHRLPDATETTPGQRRIQAPDPGIPGFQGRAVALGIVLGLPLVEALSGMMAVALASSSRRSTTCAGDESSIPPGCPQITDFLDLRRLFLGYVLAALALLVVIMVVLALAQRALRYRLPDPSWYHDRDVLLFGAMLSVVTAVVVLPAYSVLQSSGYALATSALATMDLPLNTRWFSARDALLDSLSPSFGPQALIAGLLTILAPLLTGTLTTWVGGKASLPQPER